MAFGELQLAQKKAAKQAVDGAAAMKCGEFRHRLCLCRNTGSLGAGARDSKATAALNSARKTGPGRSFRRPKRPWFTHADLAQRGQAM